VREPYQETQPDRWFVIIAEICTFFAFFGWHEIFIWSHYKFWWSLNSAAVVVFVIQATLIYLRRFYVTVLIAWLVALFPFVYFLCFLLMPTDEFRFWSHTRLVPLAQTFGFGKVAVPLFTAGTLLQLAALSVLIYRQIASALGSRVPEDHRRPYDAFRKPRT
jgi:hypothetical protein